MNHYDLVDRTCPLCDDSSHSIEKIKPNFDFNKLDAYGYSSRKTPEFMRFRMMKCNKCDILYASPALPEDRINELYKETEFEGGVESEYASYTYLNALKTLSNKLIDRQKALDIGTGNGDFLKRLIEFGFTSVEGVEPSKVAASGAGPDIIDKIKIGPFSVENFKKGTYSLITCFQTMEHVYSPSLLARDIFSLLKPGGIALFVGHNRDAFLNRILSTKSPIFDIEHLQLFSCKSAIKLFEGASFTYVKVFSIQNRYPISYWLKLLPIPRLLKRACNKMLNLFGVAQFPLSFSVGNQAIAAQK